MKERFKADLHDQLNFIRRSCAAIDEGEARECIRVAAAMRVMFNDSRRSTSLLTHLDAQDICILTTGKVLAFYVPGAPTPTFADSTLVIMDPGDRRAPIKPAFGNGLRKPSVVPFRVWWTEPIMVIESEPVSRKDVILNAADKDGGAHIDVSFPKSYEALRRGFWTFHAPGQAPRQLDQTLSATLRQMGWEVTNSPDLINLS